MTEPRTLAALMRNLVDERDEAVVQLLTLCQAYAPDLFNEMAKVAEEHRRRGRGSAGLFAGMRGIYGRVVEAFAETARKNLVEGRFGEALEACDGFAYGLADKGLRNEVLGQKGRWSEVRTNERRGQATGDEPRNALRQAILATIDAIVEAAGLPAGARRASEPVVTQGEDVTPAQPVVEGTGLAGERAERSIIGAESDLVLACENLGRRYTRSEVDALSGVRLKILRGRILGVVGLNGSGKSTLLTILAGDLAPTEGVVERHSLQRADVAFVPQKTEAWAGQLADHLSLYAAYYGHTGRKNETLVEETLALLDLQRVRAHRYTEMSAGVQTRCALARALVSVAKILILDEPLAALDPVAQYRFLADLYAHARYARRLLPVILSSQHIDAVESFADDMLVLRDGRPIFCGPTVELGADRAENVFEIRCALSEQALRRALSVLNPHAISRRTSGQSTDAGALFEVRVSAAAGVGDVLQALRDGGAEPSYFADLSRSSLALLLEGRQG